MTLIEIINELLVIISQIQLKNDPQCEKIDNSSKQMFATGARNLSTADHMNASNLVLNRSQRKENRETSGNGRL